MDITALRRSLGRESIATTRLYAGTVASTPRRFDEITDPTARARRRCLAAAR